MKNHEQRQAMIADQCSRLEKLLASVAELGTPVSPHLQDVGSIKRKTKQALSEDKLKEIEHELTGLFGRLKSIAAADGDAIISARRYALFLNGSR